MKFSTNIICLIVSWYLQACSAYLIEINPDILQNKVEDYITYGLRHKEMQLRRFRFAWKGIAKEGWGCEDSSQRYRAKEYFDAVNFQKKSLKGDELLESLVAHFETEFGKRIDAIQRLRSAAEQSFSGTNALFTECCAISQNDVKYNEAFKTSIAKDRACDRVSSRATSESVRLSSSAFQQAAMENIRITPTLKWQYFGSKEGITTVFPASVVSECSTYDSRFTPWYVQAAVPHTKQTVIIMDRSGSMAEVYEGVQMMSLVKEAAKSVIETLNPYDMFAVVAISDKQETLTNYSDYGVCFHRNLAHATPKNKREVFAFIDGVVPSGGTYYEAGLQKAFSFFAEEAATDDEVDHGHGEEEADKSMHFISDGLPNDDPVKILEKLAILHNDTENEVRFMTYGVGISDFQILKDMAKVNPDDHQVGEFTQVTSITQLRNRMVEHYALYAEDSGIVRDPIWTVPYLDSLGTGQIMTASLPVYKDGGLIGVVAIEVAMEDLFAESSYFTPNEFTYSFLIDSTGLLINHPLIPYVDDRDSLYVYATAFERDEEFDPVFDEMREGHHGDLEFESTKITTHGNSRRYGVKSRRVSAHYYFEKIPRTKYRVCVVTSGDGRDVIAPTEWKSDEERFHYHRFDLLPPENPCSHLSTLSILNDSAFVLAPRAFNDPNYFINNVMTTSDAEEIVNYIEGRGNNTQNIKDGIKEEIIATHHAKTLWTNLDENRILQNDLVWRYIGTRNGVFYVYPGHAYPISYDATHRPWYEHALAHRGQAASITPPYMDAGTGMAVVTLSRTLFVGNSNGEHDAATDEVFGVMGTDILVSHFTDLFFDMYPLCHDTARFRCLLIDLGGYVLVTNKVSNDYMTLRDLHAEHDWETHLTKVEPEISSVLIRDHVLQQTNCSNIEAGIFQRMYKIHSTQQEYRGTYTRGFFDLFVFQIIPVKNTNVFIIIKFLTQSACANTDFTCPCSSKGCTTNGTEVNNCECPCATTNPYYFSCENEYTPEESTLPCTPEHKQIKDSIIGRLSSADMYPMCYKTAFTLSDTGGNDNIAAIVTGSITGILIILGITLLIYEFPRLSQSWQNDGDEGSSKKKKSLAHYTANAVSMESLEAIINEGEKSKEPSTEAAPVRLMLQQQPEPNLETLGDSAQRNEIPVLGITKSGSNISENSSISGAPHAHSASSDKSALYLPGNTMSRLSNRSIMNFANESTPPTAKDTLTTAKHLRRTTPESSDDEMQFVHGSRSNSAKILSDVTDSTVSGMEIKSDAVLSDSSATSLPDKLEKPDKRALSLQIEAEPTKDPGKRNMSLPGRRFSRIPNLQNFLDPDSKLASDNKSSDSSGSSTQEQIRQMKESKRKQATQDRKSTKNADKNRTGGLNKRLASGRGKDGSRDYEDDADLPSDEEEALATDAGLLKHQTQRSHSLQIDGATKEQGKRNLSLPLNQYNEAIESDTGVRSELTAQEIEARSGIADAIPEEGSSANTMGTSDESVSGIIISRKDGKKVGSLKSDSLLEENEDAKLNQMSSQKANTSNERSQHKPSDEKSENERTKPMSLPVSNLVAQNSSPSTKDSIPEIDYKEDSV